MKKVFVILFIIVAVFAVRGVLYFGPLYPTSENYSDYMKIPEDTSEIDDNRYFFKCCGHDLGGVMAASYNAWVQKVPLGHRTTYVYYNSDDIAILATSEFDWFFNSKEN